MVNMVFSLNVLLLNAVLDFSLNLKHAVAKGNYGLGLFLDLSKAFDKIDCGILSHELEWHGIQGPALDWFRSYFETRYQYVHIHGINSNRSLNNLGKAHGSLS